MMCWWIRGRTRTRHHFLGENIFSLPKNFEFSSLFKNYAKGLANLAQNTTKMTKERGTQVVLSLQNSIKSFCIFFPTPHCKADEDWGWMFFSAWVCAVHVLCTFCHMQTEVLFGRWYFFPGIFFSAVPNSIESVVATPRPPPPQCRHPRTGLARPRGLRTGRTVWRKMRSFLVYYFNNHQ